MTPDELESLSDNELRILDARLAWRRMARAKQLPPDQWPKNFLFKGVRGPRDWLVWGIRSGRGFGKTRSAAEWLWGEAVDDPGSYNFVIAPTRSDTEKTCFNGESGLIATLPPELVLNFNKTDLILDVWTGAAPSQIRGFGAESPERLRGPQSTRVWGDEVASWKDPDDVWSNMMFGLRLGKKNRICWTGTPKPSIFVRELIEDPDPLTFVIQGATKENRANLSETFYKNIAKYAGTVLGRQELDGELLNPEEAGIVKRSQFRVWRLDHPLPHFDFILYSLDTAYTEKTFDKKKMQADPTACSVWGLFRWQEEHHVMLLDAWDEHLGLPALTARVKKESGYHYGASTRMAGEGTILRPAKPLPGMGRKSDLIIIEDKGSGISLRQQLAASNILTHPYNPGSADKLSRLHAITPMFAHGRVWCIESDAKNGQPKSWAEPLISQVCSYVGPGSTKHDDYVDCTSQALRYIMDQWRLSFVKRVSDRDRNEVLAAVKQQRTNPYG